MQEYEAPSPVLAELFKHGTLQLYSKSETIPTDKGFYQIVSGYIALYEDTGKVHRKLLMIFGKDDIFPYPFQRFDYGHGRTYHYCAIDEARVRCIPHDEMKKLLDGGGDISLAAIRYMATILNMAFERIADLEDLTVMQRLKKRLNFFADRFGVPGADRVVIDIPLTHADIALSIGATRETVNRMLNQLEKEKKISMRNRKIIIHRNTFSQ